MIIIIKCMASRLVILQATRPKQLAPQYIPITVKNVFSQLIDSPENVGQSGHCCAWILNIYLLSVLLSDFKWVNLHVTVNHF